MQITVKDAVQLLRDAECVSFCRNGNIIVKYCKTAAEDAILEAFGDFLVNEICSTGDFTYELVLATRLVKVGDSV